MTVVATLLAAYDPNDIKPGWIALGIVLALCIATFFLWRSMNTQLRRIKAPTKAEVAERERAGDDARTGGPDEGPEAEGDGGGR
jgi:hypothetical protein